MYKYINDKFYAKCSLKETVKLHESWPDLMIDWLELQGVPQHWTPENLDKSQAWTPGNFLSA